MPFCTLVIGDIHGCFAQLESLLHAVAPSDKDRLIFLGDCIDRGPDSNKVIGRVIDLVRSHRAVVIKGNHEQLMLDARLSRSGESEWLLNGGDATLRSYAGFRAKLADVPRAHWHFLEHDLVDFVETDTHLFVHAAAYPDLPMTEQPDYVLRWERFDGIMPHKSGKVIVCGHTPQKSGKPLNKGYAICLDTFAFGGGSLTCMDAGSGKLWMATPDGKVERGHISDYSG